MNYNYKQKLDLRNKLLDEIRYNNKNVNNLSMKEWYSTYMPFLPKEVLEIIPILELEKKKIIELEEPLIYLSTLFNHS